jgi:dihydrodiol dehydrogenase / D-xylose 1-dehydrogenase (NADP)
MRAKIYNWGFVAAGKMARVMAEDLALLPNARVHSVVSWTAESSRAFANLFSGCRQYESLEKLAADPDVDIIYISSPNDLHHPQAKLALEAGKPVLCEKPFTLNARQLAELIEIARASKTFLMEAMWIRWLPIIVKLRELLAQQAIGEPRLLKASFHAQLNADPQGRIYNLAMGGGSLLDLGIYPISFASLIFGDQPNEIASVAHIGKTGIDEHFSASFQYNNAAMATVSAGVDGTFRDDISIHGETGSIRVENPWKMSRLHYEPRDGEHQTITLPFVGRGYSYQAAEVMRCLDAGLLESQVMPLDESLAIMQTLDRLRSQWKLVFPNE